MDNYSRQGKQALAQQCSLHCVNWKLIQVDFIQAQMRLHRMYCRSEQLHCMAFVLIRAKRVLQKRRLFQPLPRSDSERFLPVEMSEH